MDKKQGKKYKKEIREAAALKYLPEKDGAPKVVALGKGDAAQKIVEAARENNVAVYEDPELAHVLNKMQLWDEIPPELYQVVAEILVFVSNIDRDYGEKYGSKK